MNKKFSILIIGFIFILTSLIFANNDKVYKVSNVISPKRIVIGDLELSFKDLDCFDTKFTDKNKELAKNLKISEEEAFIMGNLGKYWASGLLKGRYVTLTDNSDIIYLKFSYKEKFKYSGYCLKDGIPCSQDKFEQQINNIRRTKYMILDLDSEEAFEINSPNVKNLKRFLVIKKFQLPKNSLNKKKNLAKKSKILPLIGDGNIKLYYTDFTNKLYPDRNCNSAICSEILNNINKAENTIDMAIYGYSRIPEIEDALISAQKRGVKIRMVYDSDANGNNIYPDTDIIAKLIPYCMSDINSKEIQNIMHNKFYIFDDKILITGSANLSHTDMSGFNSNSIVVIESKEVAQIYKNEFEQMFKGKFHNDKKAQITKSVNISGTNIDIYFSPQDKCITKALIPLINNAEQYIYIPTFVLTDRNITSALIAAKKRGVDVRIIIDALNASVEHSKHKALRNGGILVKTENYAGKMHSKSMLIDDKYTIVGSMNFSYSGENKNDENLIIIQNSQMTKAYKEFFLYQWNRIDDKWLKLNARAEGKDSIGSCSDGLDNNYDGLTDMEDPACK